MKSILLTTTAIVAFAGAAAADGHTSVAHSLSATLGYNDTENAFDDNELGFYWEGNLTTTATAALDNGLTAGAYFEIEVAGDNDGINDDGGNILESSDFVLSLTSDMAGLYYGDTGRAAEQYWVSAGDMESDGVSTGSDSAVIRGDVDFGAYQASVSYIIDEETDSEEQLSFGAAADFGVVSLTVAYQEETDFADSDGDFSGDEILGVSATGSFAGATLTVAYADNTTADSQSTGVKVAYPFGPVTATAYYVDEAGTDLPDEDPNYGVNVAYADGPIAAAVDFQDDQGTTITALDVSYDVGNGITAFAGYEVNDLESGADYADEFYVAGTFDLGGGASVLVSYAEGEDNADDEIGAGEYQEGTTVELNFAF